MFTLSIRYKLNIVEENYVFLSLSRRDTHAINIHMNNSHQKITIENAIRDFIIKLGVEGNFAYVRVSLNVIEMCGTKSFIDSVIEKIERTYKKSYFIKEREIDTLFKVVKRIDHKAIYNSIDYVEHFFVDHLLCGASHFLDALNINYFYNKECSKTYVILKDIE